LELISTAGIEKQDLYLPVNDTATAAVAVGVGVHLTGEKGTCAMHRNNLIIEHATGHHTRKSKGTVWDTSIEECKAIRKNAYEFGSYNHNNKKYTWRTLELWCIANCKHCKRIALPASTRAAGGCLLYQTILTQKILFGEYWRATGKKDGKKELTNEDFIQIAELEAVLYPLSVLVKRVQTDDPGSMSYSFLHFFPTYVLHKLNWARYVATTCKDTNVEPNNWWSDRAKFPK
jgi:hypothetical protein